MPTVFVSNIRGTDDQETRARWCADYGCALMANQADLTDIEATVRKLQNSELRKSLSDKCATLPATTGATEIADLLLSLDKPTAVSRAMTNIHLPLFSTMTVLRKKPINALKHMIVFALEKVGLSYRALFPHRIDTPPITGSPIFSDTTDVNELRAYVRAPRRFEHLITDTTERYRKKRSEIATKAYDL